MSLNLPIISDSILYAIVSHSPLVKEDRVLNNKYTRFIFVLKKIKT